LQELQLIYEALISSNAVLWPLVKNLLEVHSQCIPIMSRLVATNDQQIIEAFYNQLQELPYDKLYTIYINLLISIELSSYSC
jgi:hypothetical protein